MARLGAANEEIEAVAMMLERQAGGEFNGVWPSHAAAFRAFLAVASQWRTALMTSAEGFRTRVVGLDYGGAKVALDALGIAVTPALWSAVQVMEQAAAAALNGEGQV